MMTEAQLLEAIHEGIHTANKNIDDWSGGYNFLTDAAAEGFMVTHIAQAIKIHNNPPPFLLLEPLVKNLKEVAGRPFPGRPSAVLRRLARVDLAVLNRDRQLKYVIEAKCSAWSDAYTRDLRRLIKMLKGFNKSHQATAMQAGIFAMFVHSYDKRGAESAKQNLENKLNEWENNIKNATMNEGKVYFSRSHLPCHSWSDGKRDGEVHLSTSLCAVIK